MKNPILNISAILSNPRVTSQLSADTKRQLDNDQLVPVTKIYRFAKDVTGLSGIQEMFSQSISKTNGVTNIEKGKFDRDAILLGVGLDVAFGGSTRFNTDALLAAADFSNKILAPVALTSAATITSVRSGAGVRVPGAVRNGVVKLSIGDDKVWEGVGDDLLVDGTVSSSATPNGDFQNFLSFTQNPKLIAQTQLVQPTINLPASVGDTTSNNYALRFNFYVVEFQKNN